MSIMDIVVSIYSARTAKRVPSRANNLAEATKMRNAAVSAEKAVERLLRLLDYGSRSPTPTGLKSSVRKRAMEVVRALNPMLDWGKTAGQFANEKKLQAAIEGFATEAEKVSSEIQQVEKSISSKPGRAPVSPEEIQQLCKAANNTRTMLQDARETLNAFLAD